MSEFNKDELEAPSWLNKSFFEDVLRKCENDNSILITDVTITPGSGKGDHYASVMFRAAIVHDTKKSKGISKSLIVKTMPEYDGLKKDMLGDSHIFETEISMYSKTIPKFEAELRKIGDNTVLGAKCYYYSLEPRKVIIFEDLVVKGYVTLRGRPLNMEEVKGALLKLAKWHAVSYKLAAEGDHSVTDYQESFLSIKDIETMPFMVSGMENFINKIATIEELKQYVPNLRSMQKDVIKRCVTSSRTYRQEGAQGVFVLNHGDVHAKNMMFKQNANGEHEDVMLVDFQVCYFGPAAMDVLYAVYMTLGPDFRRYNREELIYYYSSNFIESLKKLKFEGEYPKVADFYIDILRHRHWELFLLAGFLPFLYGIADGDTEIDDMMQSDEKRKQIYDNELYLEEVKRILPSMLHQGYLE